MSRPSSPGGATLALLLARRSISDPDQIAAVHDAYDTVRANSAALLVDATIDLLADLRRDVEAEAHAVVVFLGRDGLVLGSAIENLDPDFAAAHTRTVVLSRVIVEQALRDLESARGQPLEIPAAFRMGKHVDRAAPGAYRSLTRYLTDAGVPVGEPGSRIVLVDTSYKGTVQEMLAAAYPQTGFSGRYLIHGAHPDDPHPHTKQGYLVHRVPDPDRGYPVPELPSDPALTFAAREAVAAIEDLHHGPYASARAWQDTRPAHSQSAGTAELDQINPVRLPARYADPNVRDAVLEAAALAVADTARDTALALAATHPDDQTRARNPTLAELTRRADQFTEAVRAWIERTDPSAPDRGLDPRLAELLDGFVHRLDRSAVRELTALAEHYRIDPAELRGYYSELARATSAEQHQATLDRAQRSLLSLDPAEHPSPPKPGAPRADGSPTPAVQAAKPAAPPRHPPSSSPEPGPTPQTRARRSIVDLDREMALDDDLTARRQPTDPSRSPQRQRRQEPDLGPEAEPGS